MKALIDAWLRPWLLTWLSLTVAAYFFLMLGAILVSTELLLLELLGYLCLLAAALAALKALWLGVRESLKDLRETWHEKPQPRS